MNFLTVDFVPMAARIGAGKIIFRCGNSTVVPLTNVSDVVAVGAKEGWVAFGEGSVPSFEAATTVTSHPLPGEERSSADPANGSGHTILGEANPGGGQLVEMRGFDDWVSGDAEGVVTPIVGKEDDNIHRFF